ncbi:MAG: VWA domain-containing protein [Proteobacteria bacterium]|nr:VWA domain-containing protein [Pseudomonadota bacterium]
MVQRFFLVLLPLAFIAACSNADFVTKAPSSAKRIQANATGEPAVSGDGDAGAKGYPDANPKGGSKSLPVKEPARGPLNNPKPQQGSLPPAQPPKAAQPAPEAVNIPDDQFAEAGKSLDVHAIFDTSGSLTEGQFATDPNCLRFEAFKTFVRALKNKLGSGADARLSITTFNSSAEFRGTHEGFLNLSNDEFNRKFKSKICASSGKTNVTDAFRVAINEARPLLKNSPKQVASVLFFSDGNPTVGSDNEALAKAEVLRELFSNRVFGIKLTGKALTVMGVPVDMTDNFMKKVVGSKKRLKEVQDAADLASTMLSFLD